jgi:hypothetical protein
VVFHRPPLSNSLHPEPNELFAIENTKSETNPKFK